MKLLIVEDDVRLAKILTVGLSSEGFIVDTVTNGISGAERGCVGNYDLVILDYKLPGKMGINVCADLRLEGKTVPILMLSAVNDPDIKAQCLDMGADDYLCKPYSFTELIARIHALLRRAPALNEQVLRVGELMLDSARYEVTYAGQLIALTNKEFLLLEYLMRHAGRVVSRGSLLEHVWDMNMNPRTNTIESHIRSLRKKLGVDRARSLIHTVPSRGYKLSTE